MNPSREQKNARVELSILLHGHAATLASVPEAYPAPRICPTTCSWCYHQGVAILQPRDTGDELAEGVG